MTVEDIQGHFSSMDEEDPAFTTKTISSQIMNNGVLHHEGLPPVERDKILEEPCYITHTLIMTALLTTQEVHEQNVQHYIFIGLIAYQCGSMFCVRQALLEHWCLDEKAQQLQRQKRNGLVHHKKCRSLHLTVFVPHS